MPKLELKIRRMKTGETLVAEFPDEGVAEAWLAERPEFVEVLRTMTAVDPEIEARLRAAMRPLDADESALAQALQAQAMAAMAEEVARLQGESKAEETDPDRPMAVRWERAKGMFLADGSDEREIPPRVREAVLAWIGERDTWVRDRGEQVVGASLTVWPGPIPGGREADRIAAGGQFVTGARLPVGEA